MPQQQQAAAFNNEGAEHTSEDDDRTNDCEHKIPSETSATGELSGRCYRGRVWVSTPRDKLTDVTITEFVTLKMLRPSQRTETSKSWHLFYDSIMFTWPMAHAPF
jgi:hypothetical protein